MPKELIVDLSAYANYWRERAEGDPVLRRLNHMDSPQRKAWQKARNGAFRALLDLKRPGPA
jgi:hypothetical protein